MFKLSTRSTYAVRAVYDLATQTPGAVVKISEIVNRQKIPRFYLEQIFVKLRRAGIVNALRGPSGGYSLAKKAGEIRMGDLVNALETSMEPLLCSMPEFFSSDCHTVDKCISHLFCQKLDGQLRQVLDNTTIADLIKEAEKGKEWYGK